MIKCRFEDGGEALLRHVTVDVLVIDGKKILFIKRAKHLTQGGKWGLVGGYLDRDERVRDAVIREVEEESGYQVSDLTLLTIRDNPDRRGEDRQNVSFVFFCKVGERVGEHDTEVDEVKWFDLDDLPDPSQIAFDHYSSIELYKEYVEKKMLLPIF